MDVLSVNVGTDDHLVIRQVPPRELPRELQRQLRRDLARREGLDHVVILDAVLLAQLALGFYHLPRLASGVAVEGVGQNAVLGLVAVEDVADACVQPSLPGEDLRHRHQAASAPRNSS